MSSHLFILEHHTLLGAPGYLQEWQWALHTKHRVNPSSNPSRPDQDPPQHLGFKGVRCEGELKEVLTLQLLTGAQFSVSAVARATFPDIPTPLSWGWLQFRVYMCTPQLLEIPTKPKGAKMLQQLGRRGWRQSCGRGLVGLDAPRALSSPIHSVILWSREQMGLITAESTGSNDCQGTVLCLLSNHPDWDTANIEPPQFCLQRSENLPHTSIQPLHGLWGQTGILRAPMQLYSQIPPLSI